MVAAQVLLLIESTGGMWYLNQLTVMFVFV